MPLGKILTQLNVVGYCRRYGISLWQCPPFLFLVMGAVIIVTSLGFYLIGNRYITDPSLIALIDIGITLVLFVIAFTINRSFERLAEASLMKSEFINIVSHQLRTPLTNVKWITDLLASKKVKVTAEKKEEYFSHLEGNVTRMRELIDELLIVSRLEEGDFPLRKKESSLADLTKDLIAQSGAFAEASNVKIEFSYQKDLPKSFFDSTMTKIVVENLMDNAIRYTKDGGKVKIRLEKRKKDLYFEIKDSGVGIPKEERKHIFQKFFRSENILKEKTEGSGLGLYITKLIIEQSGGKIWFESKEGKGTTFYFTIPIK